LPIAFFCDICGKEIKEQAEDEGPDVGSLFLSYGAYGDARTGPMRFDLDMLCEECTNQLHTAIQTVIDKKAIVNASRILSQTQQESPV